MSKKYTEIANIEHVAGFDPKTGYYAYSKMVRDIFFAGYVIGA